MTESYGWTPDDNHPIARRYFRRATPVIDREGRLHIDLQGCEPMGYPTKPPPEEIREQVARLSRWLLEQRAEEPSEAEQAAHRAIMQVRT